ncbi:hypothetical protein G6F32_014336 [Rhizopus arrhizus]|nr:hypothetical protein G6F32_014336 [Rhizopus arrhizus]
MAQQVIAQHVEIRFQQRDQVIPQRVVQADAVQQHQRRALAGTAARRAHFDCASCASSCSSESRLPLRWCGRPEVAAPKAITISSGAGASLMLVCTVR